MSFEIASILASQTGVCHTPLRRAEDAGKKTPEIKEVEQEEMIEETEIIQKTYNAQGKTIEYQTYHTHLDIIAY